MTRHVRSAGIRCDGRSSRRESSGRRRGAVALELALVSMILLIFVIGIVEVGRLIMIQQIVVNAAREGARFAVVPGRTDQEVLDVIDDYVTRSLGDVGQMSGYSRSIDPTLATAGAHARISVTVNVAYSDLAWYNMLIGSPTLSAVSRMRKEI